MQKNISLLEDKLEVKFKNTDILKNALVHRSYLNEHKDFPIEQNERLEFLGDAVLELSVTDYLYHNYQENEGTLTNWRSALVNATHLGMIAEKLGIYGFLYLSKGESQDTNKKARAYILANAMEALLGAIYLDQGFRVVDKFIKKNILVTLPDIIASQTYIDAKSRFQEKAQEIKNVTPRYRVLSESGPDHNKKFIIGVYLDKELVADGEGYSKQEAQTAAATKALKIKGW